MGGEWGEWLRRVDALRKELRSKRLPPAAELVRESRLRAAGTRLGYVFTPTEAAAHLTKG